MLIAFVHNSRSFLPEITAYTRYFETKGLVCKVVQPEELSGLKPAVAWHFMGTDRHPKPAGTTTVHEYTSASVPPFSNIKNQAKKWMNAKPQYRIFLNEYVQNALGFSDDVPFGYRDMGIHEHWLQQPQDVPKQYDFIYVGEWKGRNIERLLDVFQNGALKDRSLLVVTKDYDELKATYGNIIFKGPVPHEEVRHFILQSRFAINYMPDVSPFNRQTSTKFLEYAACGVPVITTAYQWVQQFRQDFGGNYFFLDEDLLNFQWEQICGYDYAFPDLSRWTWEKQIEGSGIMAFLQTLAS